MITPPESLSVGETRLTPWQQDSHHVDLLFSAWQDPEIRRWSVLPAEPTKEKAARFVAVDSKPQPHTVGLVISDSNGGLLGEVSASGVDHVSADTTIAWWLLPAGRGFGHATAAVELMCSWLASEQQCREISALIHPENAASVAVAERCGFVDTGVAKGSQRVFKFGC